MAAGAGVLVAEVLTLAGEVAGMSFDEIGQLVVVRGRELLRMITQHAPGWPGGCGAAGGAGHRR